MPTGSIRCTRSTRAATRRSSPSRSAGRSRRSPRPGRPTTTCRFRSGAWPSWPTSWSPRGWTGDISHEGLRILLREEGVTFQRLKTWKASKDPRFAAKKARIEHLYAIADREITPAGGDPEIVFCFDEFGPLNLQPRPGRQWAAVSGKNKEPGRAPRRRLRATYTRTAGVRHLLAAYELGEDKLYGHIKPRKTRARFLEFCRYLRSLYPPSTRIAIICDNFSPHLSTRKDTRVGTWATANNVEIACTPTNSSYLNRIRGAVHRAALLRAGRHRPCQPQRAGQHDPPVHHLAQQPRLRPTTPPHRRAGERSLMRH